MSEPVFMQIPVPENLDTELSVLAACVYLLERNPVAARCSRNLTPLEQERITRYLAERFAPSGGEKL